MSYIILAGTGFDYPRKTQIRALVVIPYEPEVEETHEAVEEENPPFA